MKAMAFEDNGWLEDAVATIIALSLAHGVFSADDLKREMRPPAHPNWPGTAFARARNAGHIQAVGFQCSKSKSRKNGVVRTWTRCEKREGTP